FQTGTAPRVLRTLDDEGAGVRIEGIGVNLEQTVVVATEDEGERVERQVASEPHVFRWMHGDLGLEELTVRPSHQAIDAVRTNDQIGTFELSDIADLSLELQPHPESAAAPLQDVEQHLARDAGKDMSPGTDLRVLVIDIDRVPAREALADLGVGLVIGIPQRPERFLGKDHPPPNGRVGWI